MNLKSIFATCCVLGLATVGSAQDDFTQYLGKITVTTNALALAADADGRLFYGTFGGPATTLKVIEDPVASLGASADPGVVIKNFPAFPSGRGIQSLALNADGDLFAAGDFGSEVQQSAWKFNRTVNGEDVTFVEDTAFGNNVFTGTLAGQKRKSSVAVINNTGNGLIALGGFFHIDFFDFAGNYNGTTLYNGGVGGSPNPGFRQYMREIQYNSVDNIIYPLRNSDTLALLLYYWKDINPTTGAGTFVEDELIGVGATNGNSGNSAQNGYYYAEQDQLITLDGDVVITGVTQPRHVRVWNSFDNGTSLSLAYSISEKDNGTTFSSLGDAVVSDNRLYISSLSEAAIYVYGAVPASINRWDAYEALK